MIASRTALLAAALGLLLGACAEEAQKTTPNVAVAEVTSLPKDPLDPAWNAAPVHVAPLLLQDLVDPRLMEVSTIEVSVRALSDRSRIAFLLSWSDPTQNEQPGPSEFPDGCAIQVPRQADADVPAPQMGEEGRGVEITFWRASWQAVVNGRGDSIRDLYPQASVDHYPFEAAPLEEGSLEKKEMESRYAPARALGNPMAGARSSPVQALVAQGPGTLAPDEQMLVDGKGVRSDEGWSVVISRPVPAGLEKDRGQVAFAVWEGSHDESGARKMRTGWIPLTWNAP